MNSLNDIVSIINELKSTNSSRAKQHILRKNNQNELLKKILFYTYGDKQFKIKQKTIEKMNFNDKDDDDIWNHNIFRMLDFLATNNINSNIVNEVEKLIRYYPDDRIKMLILDIIQKDLRCNISVKTINTAIPGLIPTFGVMLAESYDKHKKAIEGKEFILSTKLDGSRLLVINRKNETLFYTRAGKRMDGLVELEESFKQLPNGCYDGELIAEGKFDNSAEQYKTTMKRSRIKGKKTGLKMMCYDFVENEKEFWSGKCNIKCIDRKARLQEVLENNKVDHIEYLYPLYIGADVDMIEKYSAEAVANQEEGIMCSIADSPYETKRVKTLLKVKLFKTADVLVEKIHRGEGKYADTLGRITVSFLYKGNKYSIDCGSGFSENQRHFYYKNPNEIVGKIVTLKYFEISKNQQGGYGLRFPIWLDIIRDDKFTLEDTNID